MIIKTTAELAEFTRKKMDNSGLKKFPGRPKKAKKSIAVNFRIEPEIFERLQWYATVCDFKKAGRPNISAAIKDILEKNLT